MRGFLVFLAVAAVSAWSGVAVAQRAAGPDTCSQASAIVALADYLLVEPKQPSRFWRDNEGSDAAFLKLRYGNLSSAEADSLLNALAARQRPPERIQELGLAHANTANRAAAIANLPKIESVVLVLRESVLRALIVDGGDWLFAELVRWRDAAPKGFAESYALANIARAVADLGDDALASLARRAEAAGLWRLGYEFYALRSDFSELVAFLNRMPEQSLGGGAQTPSEKRKNLLGQALSRASFRSPSLETTKPPVEVQALVGERPHLAMMRPFGPLFAQAPDTALLATIFNRTGEKRIATDVAKGLLDDIESGRLDPVAAPDSVIASMADRLRAVLGAKEAEEELEAITGTGASKVYRNDVAEFVHRALARQALMPFIRGETTVAPARPAALSAKFDWDLWLRVANDIAAGRQLSDTDRLIAADLQGNAGQASEAIKSLSLFGPRAEARSIAYDVMRRLDRRCGNLLRPAVPLQETLYRFP